MKRILTAIVLILVVFALIFFGQLWMITLFSAVVAELAAYEYLKLAAVGAESHGLKLRIPIWWMALGTALAFVVTLPNFPVEAQLPDDIYRRFGIHIRREVVKTPAQASHLDFTFAWCGSITACGR